MSKGGDKEVGWHLDRHIPIALLMAIGIQTAGGFWWAATISANVSNMELRVAKLETGAALTVAQGNQLAAMDAKMSSMQDSLKELKSLVMSLMGSSLIKGGHPQQ